MEPFAFVDLVPITAAALFLALAMGFGGPRLASNALAWGFALRLLQIGLRAADYGPFARTEDADRFAKGSRAIAEGGEGIYFRGGSERWEHLLALGRRQLGLSVVGLEVTAVLIWLVAGWLLLATIRSLSNDPRAERALWLVALLPAGLLWTSGLLRESTEFAFAALATYVYVRLQRTNAVASSRAPVLAAAATLALGGLLHEALFYASIFFVVGCELLRIVMEPDGRLRPVAATMIAVGAIGAAILLAGTIQTLLGTHEPGVHNAGEAAYAMSPPSLGPLTTPVDLILRYMLYVLSPMPWTLRGPFDLIGFAEALARIVLLVGAWRGRHHGPAVAMTLIMAIAIQFCFAVGTVNWGTAMRHHYVSLAPLAVAYAISTARSRSHATEVAHAPLIRPAARLVHA